MYYSKINRNDIANGVGVRVSLFVSGCRNRCPGCFNQEAWDFCAGAPFTAQTEEDILAALAPDWIAGLSLLGGDPFEPENEAALVPFIRRVRATYPNKNIWCWTGYLYEDLQDRPLLKLVDVLVDGPFVMAQKDISLTWRGSANQRVIPLTEGVRLD
ncbi:MAG: anaerobic ribonucleoside-triphosphate reductase activating protein [Clostridia bacterium]|nr:anaerobic ribonucleoside-triphosphate reductase activating protein [Clostridia bacterium]